MIISTICAFMISDIAFSWTTVMVVLQESPTHASFGRLVRIQPYKWKVLTVKYANEYLQHLE